MARRTVVSKRAQKDVLRRQRKREKMRKKAVSPAAPAQAQKQPKCPGRRRGVKAPLKRDKYAAGGKFSNLRQRGYEGVSSGALIAASLGVAPTSQSAATAAALSKSLDLTAPPTEWLPKPRKSKKAKRSTSHLAKASQRQKQQQECPVARAILDAAAGEPPAPVVVPRFADVINVPTPKEKKDLLLARTLLQQLCQQSGVTFTAKAEASGERNKFNVPVFLAHATVTVDGRQVTHSAPSTSPNVAVQLAQQGLLFQLLPGKSLAEVQQQLKSRQKRSKKERQANSKQKREQFIMRLFPGCTSMTEARAQMRAGWPSRKNRRKRSHEESDGPVQGRLEMDADEEGDRPAKKRRRMDVD